MDLGMSNKLDDTFFEDSTGENPDETRPLKRFDFVYMLLTSLVHSLPNQQVVITPKMIEEITKSTALMLAFKESGDIVLMTQEMSNPN
jgi:hypothetical protein